MSAKRPASIAASASSPAAGSKVSGCADTLLPGGSDWQSVRYGDGAWMLNVRIVLKTDDDAIIGMPYTGIRHGPKEVLDRIARGEVVKASDYYLRIAGSFETSSEKYAWLNNIICLGVGHRLPEGPIYQVFEML